MERTWYNIKLENGLIINIYTPHELRIKNSVLINIESTTILFNKQIKEIYVTEFDEVLKPIGDKE